MPELITSQQWQAYYQANACNQLPIHWNEGPQLSAAEKYAIIPSLQAWQLGETSDGIQLLAVTLRYANAVSDPEFFTAMQLFIAEEQRHGELLGRFLDLQGANRINKNWGDTIFRLIRHFLSNMETWTTVVIIVETMALVYYRAVMLATGSRVLRTICRQILKDEVYHLRFQYERLARMYAERRPCARWLTLCLQRILFFGTVMAVWIGHHRALRAGGYPLRRFWRTTWKRMTFHWQRMQLIPPARRKTRLGNNLRKTICEKYGEGRTPIELFIAGVREWETGLRRFLDDSVDGK